MRVSEVSRPGGFGLFSVYFKRGSIRIVVAEIRGSSKVTIKMKANQGINLGISKKVIATSGLEGNIANFGEGSME